MKKKFNSAYLDLWWDLYGYSIAKPWEMQHCGLAEYTG
jgi:hypothetical protein